MVSCITLPGLYSCKHCQTLGTFCETPFDCTEITCPFCSQYATTLSYQSPNLAWNTYCTNCNLLFGIGCDHAVREPYKDIFFAAVVKRYNYLNVWYTGMPVFESKAMAEYLVPHMVIEFVCTCHGNCTQQLCSASLQPVRKCCTNNIGTQ